MSEEVHLENLVPYLQHSIAKLDINFLRRLLIETSGSKTPHVCKEFSKKLGFKWNEKHRVSSLVRGWFTGKRNIRIKHLQQLLKISKYSWKNIEKNLIFIKSGTNHGESYLHFPVKLDENLGSIIGYILGDGSIDKRYLQPFFTNQNKELLSDFENIMLEIFGIRPRIWYQKPNNFKGQKSQWIKRVDSVEEIPKGFQGGLFYPKVIGKILLGIFGKFSLGKRKEITEKIMYTNVEFKKGLIKSFFDSEGSVGPEMIRVYQDKRSILEKIRKILLEFNIEPNKTSWYMKRNKRRCLFSITGFYNFLKFFKEIGFISTDKSEKLRKNILRLKNSPTFRLRKNQTKSLILELLKNNQPLTNTEMSILLKQIYPRLRWNSKTISIHLKDLMNKELVYKTENGFKLK